MQESEGIDTTSIQIREPFQNRRVFHMFVLMHACTCMVLTWVRVQDCCLHVVAKELASTLHTTLAAGLSIPDWYLKI